jgi:Penicillin binding protein transpeptidase domain/NTF2-like N-terminal transpeptidase domain
VHAQSTRPRKRRRWPAVAIAVVLVAAAAGASAAYLLLRTSGSPRQTAAAYLRAWQQGDYPAMTKASVGAPPGGLGRPIRQLATELGLRSIRLVLGRVTNTGGSAAQAGFIAAASLASGHIWRYRGQLKLVKRSRHWWVDWAPSAVYPRLAAGERFVLQVAWPARGQVLAADGTVLSSPQVIARSGSISLLTGDIVKATAAQARALGAPYKPGDLIGDGGIEQAYQARLAGRPALQIQIVGPGSRVDAAARFPAAPGKPVRTSISMKYQLAASHAIASAATTKPIDLVAIQPSTGKVLAVAERPGGFNRALEGRFPPGSTFKIVTAAALAKAGMRPSSPVPCPATVNIGGRVFHNFNNEHLGSTTLLNAFAVSCNTTFAALATSKLNGRALASMARTFGFNAPAALGIPASLGRFSTPHQPVELAADGFGQGTDLVSPLSQAAEAGAVGSGTWLPSMLVTSPAPAQAASPHKLAPGILNTLRPMMRAVVTHGTAAGVGLPPGVYGKTGTAEYGSGPSPPSHAWFIGYRGDVAFAVLVEGGGVGADASAPIANAFLRKL